MYEGIPYFTILLNKKTDTTILCLINLLSKNYISYYVVNELNADDYVKFFNLAQS